ncbi:DUF6603 domain-containing protein [Aquabacterium sp.]|uniref:DUF6603 domain-containing protein n=1 Tax=Aquabacterium sp. TaxID=1872578 RepID=UPI0025C4053F|nr:DUF6603 domain-containing protein [Aquabacterium sp.]
MADTAFERVHAWFVQAVERAVQDVADVALRDALRKALWALADPVDRQVAPPPADPSAFNQPNLSGQSLSIAALVVGKAATLVGPLQALLGALGGQDLAAAKAAVSTLIALIREAMGGLRFSPSAFGLGQLLLSLSRDLETAPSGDGTAPQARKLAELVGSDTASLRRTSSTLGVQTLVLGAVLDKAFSSDPTAQITDFANFAIPSIAGAIPLPTALVLPLNATGDIPGASGGLTLTEFDISRGIRFALNLLLDRTHDTGDGQLTLRLQAGGGVQLRWDGPAAGVSQDPAQPFGASLAVGLKGRDEATPALSLPPASSPSAVRLEIGELSAGLSLNRPGGVSGQLAPSVTLALKQGKLVLDVTRIDPALLAKVLGDRVEVAFDIEALADGAGGLRLKDGSGVQVNLPIKALPTGPFKLQLITFGIRPNEDFSVLTTELSVSCGLDLGPFKTSVERLGATVAVRLSDGETTLDVKPPNGLAMMLDAGAIQGGGYLSLDDEAGEYKGYFELRIAQIGVKALGLLHTKRPGGNWSLLLLIFGNFPPIQLSWGFVLTGVGGLIGVQHTADTSAMSRQLGEGSLDAILFPQDVASNAPQIFQTLSTLFPFKPGGFVIGPMLEVGWGTPTLVSLRMGVLIESSQIAILGQLVIQIPPLVDKQLAIILLQLDFVGVIVFDPFKIAFDGKLRDSRVALITLTGQFAFRAAFGDKPTFLISAGGFHPRFADIPPDVPMPFDRIGAGFSIGIVGMSVKGYFAVTAATVQGGFEIKAWGDVGVASFDAGLGFDAICYLQPKFCFEVDFRAWAHAEVFGIGLGVSLAGLLKGPGRWRIRGEASVDLGFFGSVDVDFDESWGEDTDTPLVTESAFALLQSEAAKPDNWSVSLPSTEASPITVGQREGQQGSLAHPMASLTFTQRRVPLRRQLDKVNEARIEGPRRLDITGVTLGGSATDAVHSAQKEQFAASQFFKMSDEDKLARPSFEAMEAGERFAFDTFASGPPVSAPVDWETRDLSPKPGHLHLLGDIGQMLQDEHLYATHPGASQWMVDMGAVQRSGQRPQQALLPPDATPLSVAEAVPMAISGKADQRSPLQGLNTGLSAGAWAATEALHQAAGSAVMASQWQVVELYELA